MSTQPLDSPHPPDFKMIRSQWCEEMRPCLRRGDDGRALTRAFSETLDAYLDSVYRACLGEWADRCAFYALGGYGRQEMVPFSDVDLMVLVPDDPPRECMNAVELFIRDLWAAGMKLGHSVRTFAQCVELSASNMQIATSLLDARFIVGGQPEAGRDPGVAVRRLIRGERLERYMHLIVEGLRHRRRQFGDSAWVLEPQVKMGRGGLRDIHALSWTAICLFDTWDLDELVDLGTVWRGEARRLANARSYLLRTRFALHLQHGWKQDQLTYASQGPVAAMMGFGEPHIPESLTRFIQAYYLHARQIAVITDLWFATWREQGTRNPRRDSGAHLSVQETADLSKNPTGIFELLDHALEHGLRLDPQARRAIATAAPTLPRSVAGDRTANAVIRKVLCTLEDNGELLKTVADTGVLAKVVPEWAHLVAYAQHDTYHVLTADEHLLTTCRRMKALLNGELQDWSPYFSKVAAAYAEKYSVGPLILGALLHDVGKGLKGDHSAIGAGMAVEVSYRMGFSMPEQHTVRRLVAEHLIMPKISQRRDLGNHATLRSFCQIVRTSELLDGLALLSLVDMDSVAPGNLTAWKRGLLEELHRKAKRLLEKGDPFGQESRSREVLRELLETDMPPTIVERLLEDLPDRFLERCELSQLVRSAHLLQRADGAPAVAFHDAPEHFFTEVLVFDPHYPGRLADVAGVLGMSGVDIRAAHSAAVGTRAMLFLFQVVTADGNSRALPEWRRERIGQDLNTVLTGGASYEDVLARRTGESRLPPRARPGVKLQVTTDNDFDPHFTLVEVKSADRPGLLASVSRHIGDLALRIDRSIITTEGDRAIDTFYVTDEDGDKLSDGEARTIVKAIRKRLLSAK